MLEGATIPTLLYPTYQHRYGFSAGVRTIVIILCMVAALSSLIFVGSLGPGRSEAIGPIHPGISRDEFRNSRLGTKRRLAICGPDAAGLRSRRHHRFRNRLLTTVYLSLGKAAKTLAKLLGVHQAGAHSMEGGLGATSYAKLS